MKIFIDGFGVVAHAITRKLLENHNVDIKNIFVNTYLLPENYPYLSFLEKNKINHTCASYKDDSFYQILREFSPDMVMSLYGRRIIPEKFLNLAKLGSFNLHPSLLPMYQGCFSGPWAIINMEAFTGITIHEMIGDVDSGDILYQQPILIDEYETGYSIWHKTASEFIYIFDEFFKNYLAGSINPKKMPEGGCYYPRKLPYDGFIDESWNETRIDAFIRAMYFPPFKGALLRRKNKILEINSKKYYKTVVRK